MCRAFTNPVWNFVQANHKYNTLLWNEEDLARRPDVAHSEIAKNKRHIDIYNQKRNDFIERIDEAIVDRIPAVHRFASKAWVSSETAGSIVDRMSINTLRVFNMQKQMKRHADKRAIEEKLVVIERQGQHLISCLNALLKGIESGTALFKTYKQFKMYNDPSLNPYLTAQDTAEQNILVIKHGSLGDWILATGAFKAIRARYPKANITLLTQVTLRVAGASERVFRRDRNR